MKPKNRVKVPAILVFNAALAAVLLIFTNATPQSNGLNRSDDRCLTAYTQADSNSILAAMNASGKSPADILWDPLESTCRHASLSIL